MKENKYEKVWVQNIKGMLRGVQFTDEMKAACLREFEAFLSEAEKREREARAKALEEAAKVACSVSDENRTGWKDTLSAHTVAKAIEDRIRGLQSEDR